MTAELRALPVVLAISPPEAFDSSDAAGRSSLTIRLACELYDEPQRLCPARDGAHLWPWHQLQNLHPIRENRDERRNCGYTNTGTDAKFPTCRPQMSRDAGTGQEKRRIESDKALGSGSSRCGQASKGVGGMPWRHQKSERGRLRNAWGSCRTSVDPGILTKTQGTETSQYLVEKKSTETPSVVASERGRA